MERYFFDFHVNDVLSLDDEGFEFANLDDAHTEAFAALAEAMIDNIKPAPGTDQQVVVEVRDKNGVALKISVRFNSQIVRTN